MSKSSENSMKMELKLKIYIRITKLLAYQLKFNEMSNKKSIKVNQNSIKVMQNDSYMYNCIEGFFFNW